MTELDVTLRDGRTLHVYDEGDPDGKVVVLHHGTPGSGLIYPPDLERGRDRGLRLVSYDRAGYSGSTRKPARSVVDVVADIEDVLDSLEVERYASLGGSGGCPHSFACGARSERCLAAAAIASPTPYPAEGIEFMAGMGEQNIKEFGLALEGPEKLEPYLEREAAEFRKASPEQLKDVLASVLPPVDAAVLTGERAEHAKRDFDRAIAHGVAGWLDDDLAFTKPWGFELSEIRVPTLLWQGVQDKMVPVSHARWLAERIPGVEAHITEEDGHLSISVGRLGEIYDWLAARF
ncbi:MAG TPA: alpha/beta hydrolase [Gaiellaceae bacterium]|nr:alpha/beta hydrolase [Gaiellaceae bacterium]